MIITTPKLLPKSGYVEVEKEDGTRTYKNIETGEYIEDEVPRQTIQEQIDDLQSAVIELTYNQALADNGIEDTETGQVEETDTESEQPAE